MCPTQPISHWYGDTTADGFLSGVSGDCSTANAYNEEQEREIAENIFDWWISKKSYKKWYSDKFEQLKLDL